ncbi:MAG: GAK system ATP-grasp enzyme [Spirochaetia bacterium]|nr:GAK system ATP-grasp enzyme [Spirochaetia bacterium]
MKKDKKIGVIGIESGWSSNVLAETIEKRTGFKLLIDIEKLGFDAVTGRTSVNGFDISSLDAVIVKKVGRDYSADMLDRMEILKYMNDNGVRVFSRPERILRVINRLSGTLALRHAGVPIPPTFVTEDLDEAHEAVRRFGRAILKPLYTSKARGMTLVEDDSTAYEKLEKFQRSGNTMMYIQKMLDIPGRDLGVVFVGGEYLTTYARIKAEGEWNTTTANGGKYSIYNPSRQLVELARRSQAVFNLDFTCVDVVETADGPYVFEVSAFGGFRGIYESSGIDAAEVYLNHVLKEIS